MTLQLTWPLMTLAVWYVILLGVAVQRRVAERYEAPSTASLADMLMISRRTVRTRTGIYVLAVWISLLVMCGLVFLFSTVLVMIVIEFVEWLQKRKRKERWG